MLPLPRRRGPVPAPAESSTDRRTFRVQSKREEMSYQNWGPQDLSAPAKTQLPEVPVERGMVLEEVQSGWVGAVTRVEKSGGMHVVALEDRRGKSRSFRLGFGFLLEGQPDPADAAGPEAGGAGRRCRPHGVGLGAGGRAARAGGQGQPHLGGRQARRRTGGEGLG